MALVCALVALGEDGKRADALTRLIADRVVELRKSGGMNQDDLGKRMAKLRPKWSRSTVVKLENYNRETVSVQELLALSIALDVPPIWLLVDPSSTAPVPIAKGVQADPWEALLWAAGVVPLGNESGGREWGRVTRSLAQVQKVVTLVKRFALIAWEHRASVALEPDTTNSQQDDETERRILMLMVEPLEELRSRGYVSYPLPPLVVERAHNLAVDLPGLEA